MGKQISRFQNLNALSKFEEKKIPPVEKLSYKDSLFGLIALKSSQNNHIYMYLTFQPEAVCILFGCRNGNHVLLPLFFCFFSRISKLLVVLFYNIITLYWALGYYTCYQYQRIKISQNQDIYMYLTFQPEAGGILLSWIQ